MKSSPASAEPINSNDEVKHPMSDVLLQLSHITKRFDDTVVLSDFSLDIHENEFVTLLGPSGCGKTTLLRIIGGFETPDSGRILFKGADMTGVPSNRRPFNTVFQKYSLFPHMNVFENIAFGLRIAKADKATINAVVRDALNTVNLPDFEKRRPDSLSGGQQQRVAIARAIVLKPSVLLFDEPLGALDLKLRQEMQLELKKLQQTLGITFLYVTHDQEEALTMSDMVVVMSHGKIQQIGSPVDIYNEPINSFVAQFIGESNIITGTMLRDYRVSFLGIECDCLDKGFAANESVDVVIRPEDIKVRRPGEGFIDCTVSSVVFKGVHYEMVLQGKGFSWLVHRTRAEEIGAEVSILFEPNDIHIMAKPNEDAGRDAG